MARSPKSQPKSQPKQQQQQRQQKQTTMSPSPSPSPKKYHKEKQKGNPWFASSHEYILSHNVEFPFEDFEILSPGHMFHKKASSRREDSMNLHGNMDHVLHVRHKKSATEFYICYIARLVLVKRFTGKMKTVLPPGFKRNKLTSNDLRFDEAFAPLLRYLPDFIKEDIRSKNARETFSSLFAVYCKKPSGAGPNIDGTAGNTTDGTAEDEVQSRRGSTDDYDGTPASTDTEPIMELTDEQYPSEYYSNSRYHSEYHSGYHSPSACSPGFPQDFVDPCSLFLRNDPFLPAVNDS